MSNLPTPPVQLSEKALSELKIVLEQDIGKEALEKLTKEEINHIGCYLLTLTATQLDIALREHKNSIDTV